MPYLCKHRKHIKLLNLIGMKTKVHENKKWNWLRCIFSLYMLINANAMFQYGYSSFYYIISCKICKRKKKLMRNELQMSVNRQHLTLSFSLTVSCACEYFKGNLMVVLAKWENKHQHHHILQFVFLKWFLKCAPVNITFRFMHTLSLSTNSAHYKNAFM